MRDPARSDALIAIEARCTPQAVWRWRLDLERAGTIEHIEPSARAVRTRTWPLTMPRKAIEAGATTAAEIMALCPGVSYNTAWQALSRARSRPQPADAAAATETLRVVRTTPRSATRLHVGTAPPAGYRHPVDPIETACPMCTLQWSSSGWQHERSCLFRARPAGR